MTIPAVAIPLALLASDFPGGADRTAGTFNAKAVAWAGSENAMVTRSQEIAVAARDNALVANQAALEANSSADVASNAAAVSSGASNFKGNWSTLTGALNRPATVKHNNRTWLLLSDLPNVAAATPGVSAAWTPQEDVLQLVKESRGTASIAGGALALDLANSINSAALNANVTSITFDNNVASATVLQSHTLELVADGTARTVVWPGGNGTSTLLLKWPNGVAPTLTSASGKVDAFFFKSRSQWLWDAYVIGQNT